ncbi:methionine--tRNA ligase, cytoplasmic-like isoform X2 [Lineus longissimus]|uniref:methionine--tRNA ligase, cytoplasmic-like isoform X2 n=1 Tax=Lineus longissimus TaxID=88925 RepID=UPI002B4E5BC1
MKLYSNHGNLQALKILVASHVGSQSVDYTEVPHDAKVTSFLAKNRLPVLELCPKNVIFSSNSATRYLMKLSNKDSPSSEIDSWLEWESTKFQPVLVPYLITTIGNGKLDSNQEGAVKKCLKHLELSLKKKDHFVDNQLTSADIVLWSSVYPLFCTKSPLRDAGSEFPTLASWFKKLEAEPAFQSAVLKITGGKDVKCFKESLLAQPVPLPETSSSGTKSKDAPKAAGSTEEETPPASAEEVAAATEAWVNGRSKVKPPREQKHPKLPIAGERNILITSALPYVNNVPHLGNIIGCVLSADVFSRIAQDIFWKLYNQGFILKDTIDQLKCESCDRFLADRFVEGTCPLCAYEDARGDQCDKCGKLINAVDLKKPRCKVCSKPPVVKTSEHLFLDLPKLEPELSKWHEKTFSEGLWTSNAKLISKSWIRDGLKPRCISRDLKWGTQVPLEGFQDKVFYVWFDAPIGYLSITANYSDQWEKWWKNPEQVELLNFMAKDNVPFHSVVFPCSQIGTRDNYTLVNSLIATEYLNYEDGKFSKSRGIGVFGNDSKDTGIPADIWRFYLLFVRPETMDSCFSWDDFVLKNNSELLNNLGNFINRALMFCANSFNGVVPEMVLQDEDKELLAQINKELKKYVENLEGVRIREGIKNVLSISRLGNGYIQLHKPWVLVKGTPEEKVRAGTIIGLGVNISCLLSTLLSPYMPEVSQMIRTQLNAPDTAMVITEELVPFLEKGHKIGKPSPLFQKIDPCRADELKKRFAGTQKEREDSPKKAASKGDAATTASSVATNGQIDPAKVDKLTAEVTQQGELVRKLKTEKAEKAMIDGAVAKLLELKRNLCIAEGKNPDAPAAKGGKKKKGGKK